jgi:hypothetical protein
MVQELWSLKVGEGVSFGLIELSGQLWTLSLLPNEIWGNLEYQNPREFCNLSNAGKNAEFQSRIRKLWPVEDGVIYEFCFPGLS